MKNPAAKRSAPAGGRPPKVPTGRAIRGGPRSTSDEGVQEAIRHCRWIALDLNADGFGQLIAASVGGRSLSVAFDSDHPISSPYLSAFLDVHDGEIARHALASSVPLWWCGQGRNEAAEGFAALPWAVRLATHGGLIPGIAFPCYPERGPHGLFVFWGRKLTVEAGTLFDLHARCFALFEAVALLRADNEGRKPQMSDRTLECLKLTAQGHTSEDIAEILDRSVHTTNQHLAEAARKLNAVNRTHAVAKAMRLRLIE